jgi:hypothetical protein
MLLKLPTMEFRDNPSSEVRVWMYGGWPMGNTAGAGAQTRYAFAEGDCCVEMSVSRERRVQLYRLMVICGVPSLLDC